MVETGRPKGIPCSETRKQEISEQFKKLWANENWRSEQIKKRIGRKHSVKTKEKQSISRSRILNSDPKYKEIVRETGLKNKGKLKGKKHFFYGKSRDEETKKKISSTRKKTVQKDRDKFTRISRQNALKASQKLISKRFKNTKPELAMKKILSNLDYEFKMHHPIWNIEHMFPADFFIPENNLIVEVDGKYWHNYPHGTEKDKIREKELRDAGYKVLRFWEDEINEQSVKTALNKIEVR